MKEFKGKLVPEIERLKLFQECFCESANCTKVEGCECCIFDAYSTELFEEWLKNEGKQFVIKAIENENV